MAYLNYIRSILPENCRIQPQANLASFISRTDGAKYQNELFRNVDFIVTDLAYRPLFVIEINDQTHLAPDRRERDRKVNNICEEAGIPLIKFWTSYGVNETYIKRKIMETLSSLPSRRVHHFTRLHEEKSTAESIPKENEFTQEAAAAGEHEEWSLDYPHFADVAEQEGFPMIAAMYRNISIAEKGHEERYLAFVKNIEVASVFAKEGEVVWQCRNCGYIEVGKEAPEVCPACLHPQAYFEIKKENY